MAATVPRWPYPSSAWKRCSAGLLRTGGCRDSGQKRVALGGRAL